MFREGMQMRTEQETAGGGGSCGCSEEVCRCVQNRRSRLEEAAVDVPRRYADVYRTGDHGWKRLRRMFREGMQMRTEQKIAGGRGCGRCSKKECRCVRNRRPQVEEVAGDVPRRNADVYRTGDRRWKRFEGMFRESMQMRTEQEITVGRGCGGWPEKVCRCVQNRRPQVEEV